MPDGGRQNPSRRNWHGGVTRRMGALDFLLCNVGVIDPVSGWDRQGPNLGIARAASFGIGKAGKLPSWDLPLICALIVSSAPRLRDLRGADRNAGPRRSRHLTARVGRELRGERYQPPHDRRFLGRLPWGSIFPGRNRYTGKGLKAGGGAGKLAIDFRLFWARRQFAPRAPLVEQLKPASCVIWAGKLHEGPGARCGGAIRHRLRVADEHDSRCRINTTR